MRPLHLLALAAPFALAPRLEAAPTGTVTVAPAASPVETYAAREVRRYLFLRTGELWPLHPRVTSGARVERGASVVVCRRDHLTALRVPADAALRRRIAALRPEGYVLQTLGPAPRALTLVCGADDAGTLYGAYRLAERLGTRFHLHGDTVPDEPLRGPLPRVSETGAPLFATRGIQPFHDFPEGPDWWNLEEYRAVIAQLPKLRMNFIGLHTYPEPIAEPTVWIGAREDADARGRVRFAYPSSYQNTARGDWGYAARPTSGFRFGAASLFDRDAYGADVMRGLAPRPRTPGDCDLLFDRTADLLRGAFSLARALGVQTCVGTETPLTVPATVRERMRAAGVDPTSHAARRALYRGIFARALAAYPVDYYWLWTPEGWTWSGASDEQVKATVDDLRAAREALEDLGAPFGLATCGWVLGPPGDRSLFDRILPKSVPISCINRQVGMTPVDSAFAEVRGRPKWAIPWLEDDPALSAPQLWAGRMRRDAFDARRYGCTGLMGIHWRTRVLGPNVAALASAAWEQGNWARAAEPRDGPVGGATATYGDARIADTDDDPLYRSVRYDMTAYHFRVPDGTYHVTLKFCEPHYDRAGARVFDVKLEGRTVIRDLDIFARVGKDRALDFDFPAVAVRDGRLDVDFVHRVEFPCIAAIAVDGAGVRLRVNCGGPKYRDWSADPPTAPRDLPVSDFYLDWATHTFGPEVGRRAGAILAAIDGKLPRPAEWTDGPGGLRPDPRPWPQVAPDYAFVDRFAALAPRVRGAGSRARYDYWRHTWEYMRAMARTRCAWGAYEGAVAAVRAMPDGDARRAAARERALPARAALVEEVRRVYEHLLETVSTTGELGTVANWEQHILPAMLDRPGEELAGWLGTPLPPEASAGTAYRGPLRIVVPAARTCVAPGERARLRVLVLASAPLKDAALMWRRMGTAAWRRVPLAHEARGCYAVSLPAIPAGAAGIEYQVRVATDGEAARWPATAPARGHTVILSPPLASAR